MIGYNVTTPGQIQDGVSCHAAKNKYESYDDDLEWAFHGIEGLEVQTLYAFVDRGPTKDLAGVLVYTRIHDDTLVLLHMAVRPEFCYSIGYKNELVLVRLLTQLRAIAKRIRGIKKLSILYADKEIPRALI